MLKYVLNLMIVQFNLIKILQFMNFNRIIYEVFSLDELKNHPPVLVDIGASESTHKLWEKFSKFSICIAYDADDRQIGYIEKDTDKFKKLYVHNCIVTNKDDSKTEFFLTESPFCSSTLEPDTENLKVWAYAEKFKVLNKIELNAKNLTESLRELNIEKVDWFKSDSQGTDLRLFNSLAKELSEKIIVAEFEPGFINSYKGEDKLSELLKDFENKPFWLSEITIKGPRRITQTQLDKYFNSSIVKKLAQFSHKISPGWAELIYIKKMDEGNFSKREILLGWIFSTVLNQHGYALLLVDSLLNNVKEESLLKLLSIMKKYSLMRIKRNILLIKFLPSFFIKLKQLLGIH